MVLVTLMTFTGGATPAFAAMDQAAAVEACRKETNRSGIEGERKKPPTVIGRFDDRVKAKTAK